MKYLTKLYIIILSISLLMSCTSTKNLAKEGINLMEGSDLLYEVKAGDKTYNFDININHFGNHISFDFDLGSEKSGTVYIEENALENATDLYNYFGNGYEELSEKTAIWISKKMFKELKAGKPVNIGLGNYNSEREIFILKGTETYSFGNKGDGMPYNILVFVITTKNNKKEIWIADDIENRLIVKMNLDFKIDLIDFKPYK